MLLESCPYENVQQYFSNSLAEIETRFLARFLLLFGYNNSNTSAIISGKIFKSARVLFRLLPKFLKFWPKFLLKFWPKFVLKFWPKLVLKYYSQNTFIFYSHKALDIQFQISTHFFVQHIEKINVNKKWSDKNETCLFGVYQ